MGTIVTIDVPVSSQDQRNNPHLHETISKAFDWFVTIERHCTRFDPDSELMQLAAHAGRPIPVSDVLYQAVQFALALAEETGGAFDPTVGYAMEKRGFNREYSTRRTVQTSMNPDVQPSYRDVRLDADEKTITLLRPLVLDLGGVAKGLAIDLAARELQELENFSIDAGGDLYLGGHNAKGALWSVGIRHPRLDGELFEIVRVSDRAVCTSGDYERRAPNESDEHHILDPHSGISPNNVASATVIAPNAMLADAVATAVFVLGPAEGIQLLDRLELEGLIITPALDRYDTAGMREYRIGSPTVL